MKLSGVNGRGVILACAVSILFTSSAAAQIDRSGYWNNGVSESWWFSAEEFTTENADTAIARWNQIGDDLKNLEMGDWAGDYFRGSDTHGTFVRWSLKSGFVMAHVDKCQAKVMGLSYGRVETSPSKIVFVPDFSKNGKSAGHSHSAESPILKFIPVRWRSSLMLVGENEMTDFGDYVAGLGRYNYNDFSYFYENVFYLRSGNSSGTVDYSEPLVPPGYERFLKKPITATITRIGKRIVKKHYSYENPDGTGASYGEPVSLTTVVVNAGSSHGLKAGMFLGIIAPREEDRVRIVRVGKVSSMGVIVRDIFEDGTEGFFDSELQKPRPHSKIKPGWRLTTSQL